jgi:hypothetical protein
MKLQNWLHSLVFTFIALDLMACSSTAAPAVSTAAPIPPTATSAPAVTAVPPTATTAPTNTQAAAFTDPFAYCAAVGTIDQPDARYTGAKMPEALAMALRKASGAAADAPLALFINAGFWRCMKGKVYGCFVGANIPCESKANVDRTPTQAETDFCKQNPNSDVIPAAVTGHETVYEWQCQNGAPTIARQVLQVDAQGYPVQFWYELSPS